MEKKAARFLPTLEKDWPRLPIQHRAMPFSILLPEKELFCSRPQKEFVPSGLTYGIDLSIKMIEEASKRALFPWVKLQQIDAEDLLFPNYSFDLVFCAFALFLFPDLQKALSECKQVLKTGGRFSVSCWGKKSAPDFWIFEKVKELGVNAKLSVNMLDTAPVL